MKRCPDCRRDYYDDSLLYCLDDGAMLLEGPASGNTEPATAILPPPDETQTRAFTNTNSSEEAGRTAQDRSNRYWLIVAAALIVLAAGGVFWYWGGRSDPQINAIAVLPFVNESGDPEIEYLSDGMTETLISSLSTLPNLSVKARSSVFRYKGRETDSKTIGKELNVQAVLNGRVLHRAGDVTLHVELVDTATENVLWRSSYNRPMANLVTLQNEIARDVSGKLRSRLSGDQQKQVAKSHTENTEAYKLYLQGRFHWNKREKEEHMRAIRYFEQAIALDPTYAMAYSGIADCYAVSSSPVRGEERYALLKAAGTKALELDPTLGEPHAAMATLHMRSFDWASAENEYRKAIELNPNYATAHQWYAELLSRLGRHDEAIASVNRALELDPLSLVINSDATYIYSFARRYDEAIAQGRKTLEMDRTWEPARYFVANAYLNKGMYEEAINEDDIGLQLSDRSAEKKKQYREEISQLREALRRSGPEGYFRKFLEIALAEAEQENEYDRMFLAKLYANAGEKDKAFEQLSTAFEEKNGELDVIKVDPLLDPLRGDPRYNELLRRMNLPL